MSRDGAAHHRAERSTPAFGATLKTNGIQPTPAAGWPPPTRSRHRRPPPPRRPWGATHRRRGAWRPPPPLATADLAATRARHPQPATRIRHPHRRGRQWQARVRGGGASIAMVRGPPLVVGPRGAGAASLPPRTGRVSRARRADAACGERRRADRSGSGGRVCGGVGTVSAAARLPSQRKE